MRFDICKQFGWQGQLSEKVISVMRMFGVDVDRLNDNAVVHQCCVDIGPGQICYITGPSGAGKSVILRSMYERSDEHQRLWLDEIELANDRCVVDCVGGSVFESLGVLAKAGLSDVFAVLNNPAYLSDGQKYRYKLACALASGRKLVFADEFCSNLDQITAAVVACNIRQFANRSGVTFVLSGTGEHFLADLAPDVLIVKQLAGPAQVIYRDRAKHDGLQTTPEGRP